MTDKQKGHSKGGENDASWSLKFCADNVRKLSDRKADKSSEGFGSILSTLTNPEKKLKIVGRNGQVRRKNFLF